MELSSEALVHPLPSTVGEELLLERANGNISAGSAR